VGYFEIGSCGTIYPGWLRTTIFLISASGVARITGVSHWHPDQVVVLLKPQTRTGLNSSCLGVFNLTSRNVLHFLAHLDFKLSKVQADPKNTDKPSGLRQCKMLCWCVQREVAVHVLSSQCLLTSPLAHAGCSTVTRLGQVCPLLR
jgi:hypothetical protein